MPVYFEAAPGGCSRLHCEVVVPRSLDETFSFFADARNLERITPPMLRFRIVGGVDERGTTFSQQLIDNRLRVRGAPLRWRTRIEDFEAPHRFVDVQVRGPYRSWHHLHEFEPVAGQPTATLMRDTVTYRPPFGRVADRLLVRRDLRHIFEWRERRILDLLG